MNYKEITVANVNDMVDGEMKKITVEENVDILLIRTNGTYNALGAYCSHYGASLDEGLICGDHVCCPWHHACFNIESGTCTEPPALNDLPRYEVKVKDNDVILYLPEKPSQSLEPSMVTQDLGRDKRMFVIVGGGAAGDSAAQSLRQVGYSGRIIMITREKWAPYDRTNLSKSYLQGTGKKEWLPLHSKNFYRENNIELMFSSEVTDIDSKNQEITIADGKCVKYDRILVATGGKPRQLNISGSGTDKVFTLRSFDDAELIIKAADQVSNIIVIGASFIGLETAFSFTKRDKKVTVVGLENVPFEYVLGKEIGNMIKAVHEQKGVQFKLGRSVTAIQNDNNTIRVVLDSGENIRGDLVVAGIGITPATEFIHDVEKADDGSIVVDKYLCAGDNIYAAGDIARFPDWRTGQSVRIEHWRTAQQQGKCAALNMAGRKTRYRNIPFFWTNQSGNQLRYVGHAGSWDDMYVSGNISSGNFVAYYVKDGVILAAAGLNRDKEMLAIEELMKNEKMPDIAAVKKKLFDILSFIN